MGDDFENLYKGEVSKSGQPILPSKRARKIPEKIQVSKEDLSEIANETSATTVPSTPDIENDSEEDVSIEDLKK